MQYTTSPQLSLMVNKAIGEDEMSGLKPASNDADATVAMKFYVDRSHGKIVAAALIYAPVPGDDNPYQCRFYNQYSEPITKPAEAPSLAVAICTAILDTEKKLSQGG